MNPHLELSLPINHPNQIQVLRKTQVAHILGLSNATLDRLRLRDCSFPAPVKLSVQAVGWPLADIEAWISTRPRASH